LKQNIEVIQKIIIRREGKREIEEEKEIIPGT
jgi:hypothetical protein